MRTNLSGVWIICCPPRTTVFMSKMSVGVMAEGSTIGLGLCGLTLPASSTTREAHCFGRPTNLLELLSKPVWTRCWKLDGAEISIFFFFFENILTFMRECPELNVDLTAEAAADSWLLLLLFLLERLLFLLLLMLLPRTEEKNI